MANDPLLIDVPASLRTARLVGRVPAPGDGAALVAAVTANRMRLRPWMPWAEAEPTLEGSEAYVRRSAALFALREVLDYHWYQAANEARFVAAGGLHTIDWSVPRFELGYWVHGDFEGQGYVRELVGALTELAFLRLGAARVEIRCDATNRRSAAVAEAGGYTLEACLRAHQRRPDGSLRDTLVFARVRTEAGAR